MHPPVADSMLPGMPPVECDASIFNGLDAQSVKLTQAVDLTALVAYLTSDQVLDYSAMSDFYLTYRMFASAEQVLDLLLLRMKWAILRNAFPGLPGTATETGQTVLADPLESRTERPERPDEQGRDVGVRTFAALRHWMLNYFADDFLPNIQLRQQMADGLNSLAALPEVMNAPPFVQIIKQLKRVWLAELAVYWQLDNPGDLNAPVAVGGAFGSATASVDLDNAAIEKRRLTLLSFYDGPISPMTAADDVRQLGSLVKGGILIDSQVKVPFIKTSPPRRPKKKRGLFSRKQKPLVYTDIHLTNKVDTLAWRVVEDLNAMLEVKAQQMAAMAREMALAAADDSPVKPALSASSSLSTLDNTVRLEPLRGSTSSGSIATVRQPKRDKTLDTLDLGTMLANTSSESDGDHDGGHDGDDDGQYFYDTPNGSREVNLRRSAAAWMSDNPMDVNPLEAMDIERVSYTGSLSSLSTLDNHSFISARSERVSKPPLHPLPPLPFSDSDRSNRSDKSMDKSLDAPKMFGTNLSSANASSMASTSGFSFENTPYSTSSMGLDDSSDDERFVDSCEDLGSPRRRRRRPVSRSLKESAHSLSPTSLNTNSANSAANAPINRANSVGDYGADTSVASLDMLNATILTPNRPRRVSSTSSRGGSPVLRRSDSWGQSIGADSPADSRTDLAECSPTTPLRDQGFVDSPRRASTSDISLLSEQSNGKIRPCKGFNPEIAAELAAIPDDSVEGDAILTALRKLEGTYMPKRLIPSYVSGDSRLYEQAFASSSQLARLQMSEVRVPSVSGLAIGEAPHAVAAACSTPPRLSQFGSQVGPQVGLPGMVSGVMSYDRARHAPFVLSVSAVDVCDQMTLIEKDALDQVDWKELVEVKWPQTPVAVESWLRLLATRNLRGVEVVVLRFNLVVDWVRSEIWLCQTPGMRAQAITRFIHIARLCRRAQNMASMMQIVLAVSSQLIKGDLASWALVAKDDLETLDRLEKLASVSHNFSQLRAEHARFDGTRGCIPFLPLYLSDLRHNHDTKPSMVDGKINFSKFTRASSLVRSLMQCVDWSKNYRLKAQPGLLSKCLYLQALTSPQLEALN